MKKMNAPTIYENKHVIRSNLSTETKITEIRFSASIAMHSPIMASDHLGLITKQAMCMNPECSNPGKNFSVHRTKCSAIIKNVFLLIVKVN